ncbi:MAG: rhamnan synthesis F family protein [Stenotrophomonas maltophilia]
MSSSVTRAVRAASQAVSRHGGGLTGLWSVLRRAFKVASAMGVRGLVNRLKQASASRIQVAQPVEHLFPAPVPLARLQQRVGLMAHVYYPDLIEEFAELLAHIPVPFELLVSVMDDTAKVQAEERFAKVPHLSALHVRVVPNRGRDIAPLLVTFRAEIMALDIVGHIHTKKSLYTGSEQEQWRHYLLRSLLGSETRVAWILGMFAAEPRLGMVYPETYESLPHWAHTWLSNADVCGALAARLGMEIDRTAYIDYPAGSMFWARVDALRPLFALNLTTSDFPVETGQVDGTLQHAVERLLATITRHQGLLVGVLAPGDMPHLISEGQRNWTEAFATPVATRIQLSALDADLVTTDVFDTLVTRPFLSPHAARDYLSFQALAQFGVDDFSAARQLAEERARMSSGRDPTLDEIYAHFPAVESTVDPQALLDLEINTEQRLLRPREGVLAAVKALQGKRVVALSDMYLPAAMLRQVLPPAVLALTSEWWVSCETAMRKDDPATWATISQREGIPMKRWLHIGDNEHADVQIPQLSGLISPVHIVRPSALLDMVPALRPLRHAAGLNAPWPEQLWRGLLANHFAAVGDRNPAHLSPRPTLGAYSAGYTVLGPVVLDYLVWLANLAKEREIGTVLFLSREGFLLQQAWDVLAGSAPVLRSLTSSYLLVSRRAAGMASLREAADLERLLHGTYTGPLVNLVASRLGEEAAVTVREQLGTLADRDIYLPEMLDQAIVTLGPALPSLLNIAAHERDAYLAYWRETVGDDAALVADIGYAGTIQTYLSSIIDRPLGGAYLALRAAARKVEGHGWAAARYHDGRTAPEEASPILAHDLLLEALLAAPSGQFCGFRDTGSGREPMFAPPELSATGQASLAQVHQGALTFIADACAAVGEDVQHLSFDPEGVLLPLQCLADGHWSAGPWLETLATDDSFTGRGRVAAGVAGSVSR